MSLGHGASIVTDGLVFYYDMGNIQKSWKGAPTFNASLQDGQNDVNPWLGDGSPTPLGIDPTVRFRGRKVAKFRTGSSGNCYINGSAKLSTGTNSTVWTSTFYLKRVDGVPLTSVGMYLYVLNNTNVNLVVSVTPVEDGWYKAVYTRSGLVAGYPTLTGMYSLGTSTEYYFADWQCENLNISSPWVSGTRTNTQALLDLTGKNTITANSLTYASNNTFSFNGTNSGIVGSANASTLGITTDLTVSIFTKRQSSPTNVLQGQAGFGTGGSVSIKNSTAFFADINSATPTRYIVNITPGGTIAPYEDAWVNLCFTISGTSIKTYFNGVQNSSVTMDTTVRPFGSEVFGLANGFGYFRMQGDLPVASVYNRALTANEVAQNFNALRGRYGI
jgi:hypothetical protein